MKKLKLLLAMLLIFSFAMPMVKAEETVAGSSEKSEVNVYLFKGNGCGYCANALSFFEEIEKDYGHYFNLVEYEVWYNKDNSDLMYEVADYMGATIKGVPFIVIGNESFPGFNDALKESIKKQIVDEYNLDESKRTDVIKLLESGVDPNASRNKKILFVSVVALVGLVGFVVLARHGIEDETVVSLSEPKNNEKEVKVVSESKIEKNEDVVEEEIEEEEVLVKKNNSKKKNSTKKDPSKANKKATNTKKKTTNNNVKKKN